MCHKQSFGGLPRQALWPSGHLAPERRPVSGSCLGMLRVYSPAKTKRLQDEREGRASAGGGSGSRGDSREEAGTSRRAPGRAARRRLRLRPGLRAGRPSPSPSSAASCIMRHGVERRAPFDPDLQLAPVLLELPGIEAAMGRQAQIDAVDARSGPAASAAVGRPSK